MPWTPDQFRSRHAHDLSPGQSAHAAQIANAILRRSPGQEGMAIATGIARAKGVRRADGGSTPDYTDQYNTQLTPTGEVLFQQQNRRSGDLRDYDMRGAWSQDQGSTSASGHLTDRYKKPNHPTFSGESMYSSSQTPGGSWAQMPNNGRWVYSPSAHNQNTYGRGNLTNYFDRVEPDSLLLNSRAFGGTFKDRPESKTWVDRLPYGHDDSTFYQDRRMAIKPNMDIDDGITAGPQPEGTPKWMEHALGGSLPRLGAGLPRISPPRLGSVGLHQRSAVTTPHLPHFDTGGDVSSATTGMYTPGVTASSDTTASPQYQSLVQRYQGMSPEQLQEFVARAGNSSAGQVARKLLNQKRVMAGSQPASSQQANQQIGQQPDQSGQVQFDQSPSIYSGYQPVQTSAFGGRIGLAGGGTPMGLSSSEADPWWTRSEARSLDNSGGGFLHSSIAGRTDHIAASPAADSYVIPADVVSGLGEGNSLAGAHMISLAMGSGPWGSKLPPGHHGPGPPHALVPRVQEESRGGPAHRISPSGLRDGSNDRVPAMLAGGEYVLTPEQVAVIGRGDVRRGHRVLDHFVVSQRQKIIKQMQKLPGPVKAAA